MWAGMGEQPTAGYTEIDLETGQPKKVNPLAAATDYEKWDKIAQRVTAHEDGSDGEDIAPYSWVEMPHADIRVRIPVWKKTKSRMVRVDFKVNWLTVYAPPTEAVVGKYKDDAPPTEPLLDFQLHGAVNPDECMWELENDGSVRIIVLTLHRAPVYKWPTLHRVGGLRREADRPRLLKEQAEKLAREQAEQSKQAPPNQETVRYAQAAGPARPPQYGPQPGPRRRPHRPKDADGNPLKETGRPPGVYERGRIIVTEPDYTDSSDDD